MKVLIMIHRSGITTLVQKEKRKVFLIVQYICAVGLGHGDYQPQKYQPQNKN